MHINTESGEDNSLINYTVVFLLSIIHISLGFQKNVLIGINLDDKVVCHVISCIDFITMGFRWMTINGPILIFNQLYMSVISVYSCSSTSGKKWRCLHLYPAWTWRGQVWLWEAWGALAADPYSGDHHDQRYLHVGRPQWRLPCQRRRSCKCPLSRLRLLSSWGQFADFDGVCVLYPAERVAGGSERGF